MVEQRIKVYDNDTEEAKRKKVEDQRRQSFGKELDTIFGITQLNTTSNNKNRVYKPKATIIHVKGDLKYVEELTLNISMTMDIWGNIGVVKSHNCVSVRGNVEKCKAGNMIYMSNMD